MQTAAPTSGARRLQLLRLSAAIPCRWRPAASWSSSSCSSSTCPACMLQQCSSQRNLQAFSSSSTSCRMNTAAAPFPLVLGGPMVRVSHGVAAVAAAIGAAVAQAAPTPMGTSRGQGWVRQGRWALPPWLLRPACCKGSDPTSPPGPCRLVLVRQRLKWGCQVGVAGQQVRAFLVNPGWGCYQSTPATSPTTARCRPRRHGLGPGRTGGSRGRWPLLLRGVGEASRRSQWGRMGGSLGLLGWACHHLDGARGWVLSAQKQALLGSMINNNSSSSSSRTSLLPGHAPHLAGGRTPVSRKLAGTCRPQAL
jgi:hypothetical protein